MKMEQVRDMARNMGIDISDLNKVQAIRRIQHRQGDEECFGRARDGRCNEMGCLFLEECLSISRHPESVEE